MMYIHFIIWHFYLTLLLQSNDITVFFLYKFTADVTIDCDDVDIRSLLVMPMSDKRWPLVGVRACLENKEAFYI